MRSSLTVAALAAAALAAPSPSLAQFDLTPIGVYAADPAGYDAGLAEIPAYDPGSQRLFVVNASRGVDILSLANPASPTKVGQIVAPGANSVSVRRGLVAVAVENVDDATAPGELRIYDTDGNLIDATTVGVLPDMVVLSPNGRYALTANEGQPNDDYTIDPPGSVSVVTLSRRGEVLENRTAGFEAFDGMENQLRAQGVRIFGPGASASQDFEPEYIALAGKLAYVTLQENNAVAVVDLKSATVTGVFPLGYKNWNASGNLLDASDRDGGIDRRNWPVFGMYQPDAVAALGYRGDTYLITANEGDARDYDGFSEEVRVEDLALDPSAFPNAADLQTDATLGRLRVTDTLGDTDGDGDFDQLYAYGARSFSVWRAEGHGLSKVYDSRGQLEARTAAALPDHFNSSNAGNDSADSRSDDKGPEPEGLALGRIRGRTYAFIGLERIGGVMVYDVTTPHRPTFVLYENSTRDFNPAFDEDFFENGGDPTAAGDLGPEGLVFIAAKDSPSGKPLLVVANEISGTTRVYEITVD